uniref:CSON000192 protein n=1 Tax=Culicoides sonorensis TaxID=179676 RepID=A0A336MEC9_CULSO
MCLIFRSILRVLLYILPILDQVLHLLKPFNLFFAGSVIQNSSNISDKESTDIIPTLADYFDINLPPDDLQRLNEVTQDTQFSRPTKAKSDDMQLLDYYNSNTVTGTPKPDQYKLDDIFISVKTTKNYHNNRLVMIIKTWFQLAKDQKNYLARHNHHHYLLYKQ